FGKNWVHRIEEGLSNSKVMFVFLSPNSLRSGWIFFESGFCYSKDIKVVPVGIKGVDLGEVGPPLNLLQGFNITSEEGLNNIITIINKNFDYNHTSSFTKQEFEKFLGVNKIDEEYGLYKIINHIEVSLAPYLIIGDEEYKLRDEDEMEDTLKNYFNDKEREFAVYDNIIHAHGLLIHKIKADNGIRFEFYLDPLLLNHNLPVIQKAINKGYPSLDKFWLRIYFNEGIELVNEDFRLSSLLYGSKVKIAGGKGFLKYDDLRFIVDECNEIKKFSKFASKEIKQCLRIVYEIDNLDVSSIFDLIECLLYHEVIFNSNSSALHLHKSRV
ncbi:MAG: toll/interleukin-1 receptor domain-containing protein, partial [bacterium]